MGKPRKDGRKKEILLAQPEVEPFPCCHTLTGPAPSLLAEILRDSSCVQTYPDLPPIHSSSSSQSRHYKKMFQPPSCLHALPQHLGYRHMWLFRWGLGSSWPLDPLPSSFHLFTQHYCYVTHCSPHCHLNHFFILGTLNSSRYTAGAP